MDGETASQIVVFGGFILFGLIVVVSTIRRQRQEEREKAAHEKAKADELLHPVRNGIPLPTIDDPRWVYRDGELHLGQFRLSNGFVYFGTTMIEYWNEYYGAVLMQVQTRRLEKIAPEALRELETAR